MRLLRPRTRTILLIGSTLKHGAMASQASSSASAINKAKRDEARTQALVQHGVAQAQGRDPPPVLLDEERLAEQCSKLESTQHEAQISTVEAPQVLSKKRRPKNRADERVDMVTSRLAADKAAEEAPEAGVNPKKRRRRALPEGPSSQPAVSPIITID